MSRPLTRSLQLGGEQNDAARLATFKSLTTAPAYVLGFEEPDCFTTGSAGIEVAAAAAVWDSVVAPMKAKGSLLGSPSMCSAYWRCRPH